jgi:hypothetical protein
MNGLRHEANLAAAQALAAHAGVNSNPNNSAGLTVGGSGGQLMKTRNPEPP